MKIKLKNSYPGSHSQSRGAGDMIRVLPFWIFFHSSEICLRSLVVKQNVALHVPGRAPDTCQTSPEHWVVSGLLESTLTVCIITDIQYWSYLPPCNKPHQNQRHKATVIFPVCRFWVGNSERALWAQLLFAAGCWWPHRPGLRNRGTHIPGVCALTWAALTWAGQAEGWAPAKTVHLHSPLFASGFSWDSNWVPRRVIWRATYPKEPGGGCMAFSVLMLAGSPIVSPLPYLLTSW